MEFTLLLSFASGVRIFNRGTACASPVRQPSPRNERSTFARNDNEESTDHPDVNGGDRIVRASAGALTLTFQDSLWVGWIDPCASGLAAEVACIDSLITLPPNGSNNAYNRVGSTVSGPLFPATTTGALAGQTDANTDGTTGNVSGFTYLLAQYGPTIHLWLSLGLTGSMTIPTNLGPGHQLTHYSLLGTDSAAPNQTEGVPDGGTTIGLLGLAMLGIGFLRRRLA